MRKGKRMSGDRMRRIAGRFIMSAASVITAAALCVMLPLSDMNLRAETESVTVTDLQTETGNAAVPNLQTEMANALAPNLQTETENAAAPDLQTETEDAAASDGTDVDSEKEITLRICNWEEYIDEGGWDEDEAIELENGTTIIGENSMIEDFEDWYYENYGIRVNVEYSCFGTNEDLYNMLTLGDVYDLVCPSEYMIMKLMAEDRLTPLSDGFFDTSNELNYYINGVSPYIKSVFDENEIDGEAWSKYAAGYMFGVTGILYNPEKMTAEEAGTWTVLNNPKFARQITIKDNVRDSYFAAVGALRADELTSEEFTSAADYSERLAEVMNDVSDETIAAAQDLLQDIKDNVYSFETDSGKADMVSGKVAANYQWSGDAVYAMDQADEDGVELAFAVPVECTNLYFDGWVMLKSGIDGDADRQQAAEAFINFMSRPDNAVRNMYYIGYTSVIAGGSDDTVYSYLEWNYGAGEDDDDTVDYPLGYFFTGDNEDADYELTAPAEQLTRQLAAQYPSQESIARSAVMQYFDEEAGKSINQMWINVRCFNINDVPAWMWAVVCAAVLAAAALRFAAGLNKRKRK